MLKQVPSWSCDYHFLILLLKFILGNSYSSYKSSAKAYIGNISIINPQSLYTSQSRVRFGRKLCFPYFLSQEKAMSSKMVYLQDYVGWSMREFLDEPWMLNSWRGSWINPKYLFAEYLVSSKCISTGWRIIAPCFISCYSHLGLIIIISTWGSSYLLPLEGHYIYCHLRVIIVLLFLAGPSLRLA